MSTQKTPVEESAAKLNTPVKKAIRKTVENNQPRRAIKKSSGPRPNNGGARPGAGRKVGAATKKTRKIADKLATDGEITPLEFLLQVMRTPPDDILAKRDKGEISTEECIELLVDLQKRRESAAEKTMQFIHPRLSAVTAEIKGTEHDQWVAMMEEAGL